MGLSFFFTWGLFFKNFSTRIVFVFKGIFPIGLFYLMLNVFFFARAFVFFKGFVFFVWREFFSKVFFFEIRKMGLFFFLKKKQKTKGVWFGLMSTEFCYCCQETHLRKKTEPFRKKETIEKIPL